MNKDASKLVQIIAATEWGYVTSQSTPFEHLCVSCGCCNKFIPPGWLKTVEIYSLQVLEVTSMKSMCQYC